ncbi:hypothetical protein FKM82_022407 [Ascaphus truei]
MFGLPFTLFCSQVYGACLAGCPAVHVVGLQFECLCFVGGGGEMRDSTAALSKMVADRGGGVDYGYGGEAGCLPPPRFSIWTQGCTGL